ncbi:hypothetical protein XSR1_520019 [Xenorhabdus szentirmaii DSM 16338]|uniref:Uncharacterized protein n=1 Tax=Xenorhabdus szentirmaii DSM 16338 TaxID=1427518 RepID=W1J218_9GAMM|nr:hypothetical protein XSR1_520019 [Xenorhabdus szentirmaii DSM 16338]
MSNTIVSSLHQNYGNENLREEVLNEFEGRNEKNALMFLMK